MNQTSTKQYILIASDVQTHDRLISAPDAIKERLKKGYWPVGGRTAHRGNFRIGDQVIFYAAGAKQGYFIATALLTSEVFHPTKGERKLLECDFDYIWGSTDGIKISEPTFFTTLVRAKDLLEQLNFIKTPHKWGAYFQRGALRINQHDLSLIIGKGLN